MRGLGKINTIIFWILLTTVKKQKDEQGRDRETSSQKRPHHKDCGSKDLARIGLRARQDLGRVFQVKRTAGAQALGQEPARGLGDEQEGLCDCRRERGCKGGNEARKRGRP